MNVLLLWTDQQRRDTLEVHGNRAGLMPQIDSLLAQSTVFTKAYCAAPVCTPSRGSFLTGLYPHAHGAMYNNQPLLSTAACLPELMAAQGRDLRSAYIGKWHLGDELFAQHGFQEWHSSEDGYQQFFSPGRDQTTISDFQQTLLDKGYQPDPKDVWKRDWAMKLPERDSKPAFIVDRAIDFCRRAGSMPWILSMNSLEPHHPLMGPCADAFTPEEVPAWPNRLHRNPHDPAYIRCKQELLYRHGFEDFHLRDEQSWRQCCAQYWGQCRQVDNQFGRFLQFLRDANLFDETLIVFCSDHGEMMGCHSLFGKCVPYEEATGIPMAIKLPGQRHQRLVETPICNVDILPTLAELLGLEGRFHGRSLAPALRGEALAEEDVLVVWNEQGEVQPEELPEWAQQIASPAVVAASQSADWRMLVAPEGWRYGLCDSGEEWLFDLRQDPYQMHNALAEAAPELLDGLRRRLRACLRRVDDQIFRWPTALA